MSNCLDQIAEPPKKGTLTMFHVTNRLRVERGGASPNPTSSCLSPQKLSSCFDGTTHAGVEIRNPLPLSVLPYTVELPFTFFGFSREEIVAARPVASPEPVAPQPPLQDRDRFLRFAPPSRPCPRLRDRRGRKTGALGFPGEGSRT